MTTVKPAAGAPRTAAGPPMIVLLALILVAAVANLNLAVANVALPDIGKAFDASQTALNLVAVGYSLGLAASVLYLGRAGRPLRPQDDAHPRRRAVGARRACSRRGHPSIEVLVVARIVGGLAAGMAYPTTLALITALWAGARPDASPIALWSALGGAISALGPLVAGRAARALLVGLGVPGHAAAGGRGAGLGPGRVVPSPRERDDRPGRQPRRHALGRDDRRHVLAINFAPVPDKGALVARPGRRSRSPPASRSSSASGGPRPALRPPHRRRGASSGSPPAPASSCSASLMGAMFVGQQFLQNVLGYSTLRGGRGDPARRRAHGARRAALGQARRGPRRPLHAARRLRRSACWASSRCSLLWDEGSPYWAGRPRLRLRRGPGSASPARRRRTRSPARCRSRAPAWRRAPPTSSATSAAPSCSRSSARC